MTYGQDPYNQTPGTPGQPGPGQPYGQPGAYPPAGPPPGAQPPQQSMTDQWLKATIDANLRSLKVTIPITIVMVLLVGGFFIFAMVFNSR